MLKYPILLKFFFVNYKNFFLELYKFFKVEYKNC